MLQSISIALALSQEPDASQIEALALERSKALELHTLDKARAKRLAGAVDVASRRFGVRPAMILAVIEAESAYGAVEVSSAKCVGLMQLNPNTAPSVAKSIGFGWYNLGRVEHNIVLGTAYLKQLFDHYGAWDKALTAYNMGMGRFKKSRKISGYAKGVLNKAWKIERQFVY